MTTLLTLIRTEAAKWLAIIAAALVGLAYVRKSGKDAEKAVNAQAETERTQGELNEINHHLQIIHDNSARTHADTTNSLRKGEF